MLVELEQEDDVCVVRVKGRIVSGADCEYLRLKQDEVKRTCSKVLVDFREVPSIGTEGVTFLVGIFRNCGGRFVLAGPQRRVLDVLDVTGLSGVLPLSRDVASGLAALHEVL